MEICSDSELFTHYKLDEYRLRLININKALNDYLFSRLKDSEDLNRYERNLKYEKYKIYNNIGYALGMLTGFALTLLISSIFIIALINSILLLILTIINFVIDRDIEIYKHKDLDKDADIRRDVFLSILAPVFIVILSSLVFFPLEITLFALCAYTALYVAAESIIDEVLEDKLKDKESNNYKYSSDKKLSFFSKQNIGKNNYIDDEHIESGYRNNQT